VDGLDGRDVETAVGVDVEVAEARGRNARARIAKSDRKEKRSEGMVG